MALAAATSGTVSMLNASPGSIASRASSCDTLASASEAAACASTCESVMSGDPSVTRLPRSTGVPITRPVVSAATSASSAAMSVPVTRSTRLTLCCAAGAAVISSGAGPDAATAGFAPDPHADATAAATASAAMRAIAVFTLCLRASARRRRPHRPGTVTGRPRHSGPASTHRRRALRRCSCAPCRDTPTPACQGRPRATCRLRHPAASSSTSSSRSLRVCAPTRSAIWPGEGRRQPAALRQEEPEEPPPLLEGPEHRLRQGLEPGARALGLAGPPSSSPKKNSHWLSTTRR